MLCGIVLFYTHCPWNSVYEKSMTVVKGGMFHVCVKQTVDIPLMDQSWRQCTTHFRILIAELSQNTEQFGDPTFSLNSNQLENHERF